MMNELRMLEERHMISILLYIAKNEGCMKTDIYREVSHAQGMPGKLDTLAEGGLIRAEGVDDRMMRRFYLTDCDFMWTYQRLRSQYVALACTMSHSLDFYDAVEPTEKKLNRFREMRRGFLVAMRKRSWLAYALCYLYMDVYSVKFALLHRNVRFLFVR